MVVADGRSIKQPAKAALDVSKVRPVEVEHQSNGRADRERLPDRLVALWSAYGRSVQPFVLPKPRDTVVRRYWREMLGFGHETGARRERHAPSPSQRFRDIQEQRLQVVDDGLLALHLAPDRRVGHGHDCVAKIPEFSFACTIVSNATVLEQTSSIRAVSFATGREQNVAVELQNVDRVVRTHLVDLRQAVPGKEQEGILDFEVEERQGILGARIDRGRRASSRRNCSPGLGNQIKDSSLAQRSVRTRKTRNGRVSAALTS